MYLMFCLFGYVFPVTPDFIMLQLFSFYEVLNKKKNMLKSSNYVLVVYDRDVTPDFANWEALMKTYLCFLDGINGPIVNATALWFMSLYQAHI